MLKLQVFGVGAPQATESRRFVPTALTTIPADTPVAIAEDEFYQILSTDCDGAKTSD
jgi:hypothetical protein